MASTNCGTDKSDLFFLPFQTAMLLLRIDDIVSGTKKASGGEGAGIAAPTTGAAGVEGME